MSADTLAVWASHPALSRGRRCPQPPSPPRHEHQRDRDRIVHSTAFRRLVYKTQVFVNHEGDLFRTRLTHSLEVAQLGRSAARALALNEDLVEAIALAHDLGHTPFGHAGQDALHACMQAHGGFEHNLQSLRVVDRLETRYAEFDGLNLTFETREGILKHCSATQAQRLEDEEPDGPAWRFVHGGQPSLEAQLVNVADELAYNAHDIDDGVRSGLIGWDQLLQVPLVAQQVDTVQAQYPALRASTDPRATKRLLGEVLRRLLSLQVADLVDTTARTLAECPVTLPRAVPGEAAHGEARRQALAWVRQRPPSVRLGETLRAQTRELKRFLFQQLYRHPHVVRVTDAAKTVVAELFAVYCEQPQEMTPEYARHPGPRAVADYIAGMTDRFALREHHRLTGRQLLAPWSGNLAAEPPAPERAGP